MATQSNLASKVADINRLINHVFTPEEMSRKLRRQGVLDEDTNILRRADLERDIKLARANGNEEKADALQKELDEIVNPKLSWGTSLIKQQTGSDKKLSEAERVHQINLRNQKLNYENVRRAQLEERKAARKSAAAVARGEAAPDPFMRVRTVAKTHHDLSDKPKDGATDDTPTETPKESPKVGTDGVARAAAASGVTPKKPKSGFMISYRNTDDENIAALDLDIDIEI
jgi:RNA polymerase-associated protein RTF1